MTHRVPVLTFFATAALTLTVGCGGSVFTTSDGDSTGGTSSGGSASGGTTSSGGSGSGGASTGGASTGGTSTGGSLITGNCNVDSDCVAVLDAAASCYSPGCSAPIAASQQDVEQNHCLVPWESREEPVPTDCISSEPTPCPLLCVAPPSCVTPVCSGGQCQVKVGYSDAECSETTDDCTALNEKFAAALKAARACNPNLDNIQCNGTEAVADLCGCPLLVNETQPELVQAARDARDAWANACPLPPCVKSLCATPTSGSCGADGVCMAN